MLVGGAKSGVKYRFWSSEEHQRLEDALRRSGKDLTKIADHVKNGSRESVYVNAHYLKKQLAKNPHEADPDLLAVLKKEKCPKEKTGKMEPIRSRLEHQGTLDQ